MDEVAWRRLEEASVDAARSIRKIFMEFKKVGFSRKEAVELAKAFIQSLKSSC